MNQSVQHHRRLSQLHKRIDKTLHVSRGFASLSAQSLRIASVEPIGTVHIELGSGAGVYLVLFHSSAKNVGIR